MTHQEHVDQKARLAIAHYSDGDPELCEELLRMLALLPGQENLRRPRDGRAGIMNDKLCIPSEKDMIPRG